VLADRTTRLCYESYLGVSHEDDVSIRAVLDIVVDNRSQNADTLGLRLKVLIVQSRIDKSLHVRSGDKLDHSLGEFTNGTRALRLKTATSHDDVSSLGAGSVSLRGHETRKAAQKNSESFHGCDVVLMKASRKKLEIMLVVVWLREISSLLG